MGAKIFCGGRHPRAHNWLRVRVTQWVGYRWAQVPCTGVISACLGSVVGELLGIIYPQCRTQYTILTMVTTYLNYYQVMYYQVLINKIPAKFCVSLHILPYLLKSSDGAINIFYSIRMLFPFTKWRPGRQTCQTRSSLKTPDFSSFYTYSIRMFSKPKTWMSGGIWKPKNPHSLEHLKWVVTVLLSIGLHSSFQLLFRSVLDFLDHWLDCDNVFPMFTLDSDIRKRWKLSDIWFNLQSLNSLDQI